MKEKKFKHGTKEYWMDWYWNRGGREKCLARRKTEQYKFKEKIARIKHAGVLV